jgi:DNA repair exonuclease SbcCD nuclease subunit
MSKVFIIGDTHIGCRSASVEFMQIVEQAHLDFIIPTIAKHYKKGDLIIQLGDVTDNRTSLNVKCMSIAINIYEKLGKIGPVHIIAGNHDIYLKHDTQISSLDCLKYIPNVNIHKEPHVLDKDGNKLLLMPWRKDTKEESDTLKAYREQGCDYAFMHGTFSLLKYNKYVNIQENDGANPKSAEGYKKVYCGHIHWSQQKGNINIVGTPYQITRGDSGNTKGFFMIDLETQKETFFENNISPKFLSFTITNIDKNQLLEINDKSRNNFVDIHINDEILSKNSAKLTKIFQKLSENTRELNIIPVDNKHEIVETESSDIIDAKLLIYTQLEQRFKNEDETKARKIVNEIFKEI